MAGPSRNIVAQVEEEKKRCEEKKAKACHPEALLLREGSPAIFPT